MSKSRSKGKGTSPKGNARTRAQAKAQTKAKAKPRGAKTPAAAQSSRRGAKATLGSKPKQAAAAKPDAAQPKPLTPPPLRWWFGAWLLLPVIAVAILVYLNSFKGQFVLDDEWAIIGNRHIRNLDSIWKILTTNRRPVVNLSLALNYALSGADGLNVWGYHLFNLIIHLLAGMTLFGVIRRSLAKLGPDFSSPWVARLAYHGPWIAMVCTLLWLVHPLQTQSVTYLIQRGESLMGLFYLLTIYAVIRSDGSRYRWWWYGLALVAAALGMGSKAVMVTVPAVVLLYDRAFLSGSFLKALRQRAPLYLALAASWSILVFVGMLQVLNPNNKGNVGFGFKGVTPLEYLQTQPQIILHYIKLCFWPAQLTIDYQWPVARDAAGIVVPSLILGTILAFTIWAVFRRPKLGFVLGFFFLILLPTSSFIPIKDLAFEHRMYLPLATVVILVVLGVYPVLPHLLRNAPAAARASLAVILVLATTMALGYRTVARNRDYYSAEAMWRSVAEQVPEQGRAEQSLGRALYLKGDLDGAERQFRKALEIDPRHVNAHVNLGNVHLRRQEYDQAIECYQNAVSIRPSEVSAHNNLGALFAMRGDNAKAIEHYREAIRHGAGESQTRYNLGLALMNTGQMEEAVTHFRAAARLNPRNADAQFQLGRALMALGRKEAATAAFERVLEIAPDDNRARRSLETLRRE